MKSFNFEEICKKYILSLPNVFSVARIYDTKNYDDITIDCDIIENEKYSTFCTNNIIDYLNDFIICETEEESKQFQDKIQEIESFGFCVDFYSKWSEK